jgi:hypothetical protein
MAIWLAHNLCGKQGWFRCLAAVLLMGLTLTGPTVQAAASGVAEGCCCGGALQAQLAVVYHMSQVLLSWGHVGRVWRIAAEPAEGRCLPHLAAATHSQAVRCVWHNVGSWCLSSGALRYRTPVQLHSCRDRLVCGTRLTKGELHPPFIEAWVLTQALSRKTVICSQWL